MESVVIVIHLLIVAALVVVVLLQRSEGGALGIGGGGGGGGFLSGRGAANLLTRTTAILATGFFATSLGLSILASMKDRPSDILDNVPVQDVPQNQGFDPKSGGILDELQQMVPSTTPDAPTTPAAPAEPAGPQVPTSQ